MSKPLCIYHGGCDDGFGAAWAVHKALGAGEVEFYPGVYQLPPPDVTDRNVIMVDFSYKRPVIEAMAAAARSILILDHHKTALEDLAGLPTPPDRWVDYQLLIAEAGCIHAQFDMHRSGAGMAWDFFVSPVSRPDFINYIEDRDLWRKSLPFGDEFTMCLRSYPQELEVWDALHHRGIQALIDEGVIIKRYYRLRVEELKRSAYPAVLGGAPCMIANAPYFAASEVAGELAEAGGTSFGACYFEVEKGKFQYSLRSRGDFDVSAIALKFGGGGHKNAAGFATFGRAHKVPTLKAPTDTAPLP